MRLTTIKKEINNLQKNNVKLSNIGNIDDLPNNTRKNIMDGVAKTQNNSGLNLILALSYGSRQELIRAFKRIGKKIQSSEIVPDDINENLIGKELYSKDIPDPDLLIRTGGEFRLCNFLLWQAAYSELLITDTHWPDFREEALLNGIYEYQNRQRRFGQTAEQITA